MKKMLFALTIAMTCASNAFAGQAKVSWQEPEKFTDIRASNETRLGFQERVFKELEQVFSDMAKQLPDGYQIEIVVTDVDLAGDVNGTYRQMGNDIRIIKEIYWPRMSFTYAIKDAQNALLSSGTENVKDMNFMSGSRFTSGHSGFVYEEKMLNDWFKKLQKDKKLPSAEKK